MYGGHDRRYYCGGGECIKPVVGPIKQIRQLTYNPKSPVALNFKSNPVHYKERGYINLGNSVKCTRQEPDTMMVRTIATTELLSLFTQIHA